MGDKEPKNMRVIIMWVKNGIKRQFNKLKHYINTKRRVLALIFLLIGASWTYVYDHKEDFQIVKTIRIEIGHSVGVVGTPAAHADTSLVGSKLSEVGASKTPASPEEIIAKYFPEEKDLAIAIAKCESQLDPSREGDLQMEKHSYGLFQINRTWHNYTPEQLKDADFNCKIAKEIRDRWGNWNAWTCYKTGGYLNYI